MTYGPLYAAAVLRPFAEQLLDEVGEIRGVHVHVVPGDAALLGAEVRHRGGVLCDAGEAAVALALATLGREATPDEGLAALREAATVATVIAAVHFTHGSAHEAIAHGALEAVGAAAPDRWLDRLSPAAITGFEVRTVRDVVRFDSPRQFYAAMIGERTADAGLDAIEKRRLLGLCTEALRPFTTYDDTVRLPVEALLLVRDRR